MWDCDNEIDFANDYSKEVIQKFIKEQQFTDFKVVVLNACKKGENYLGCIRSVSVTGTKQNGEKAELNVILKIPLDSMILRQKYPVTKLYNREVLGYNVVLPKLVKFQSKFNICESGKFKLIKCYSADSTEMKEYLILEDMRKQGFKIVDRKTSLDLKQLRLVLEALANLHALSFGMRYENPQEFSEFTKDLENPMSVDRAFENYLNLQRDRAIQTLEDPLYIEKIKAFGVGLYDKMMSFVNSSTAEPYNVICHGDSWTNNILFKYEGHNPVDIIFLDWQILRFTSPIIDIAFLLFTSTDEEVRKDFFGLLNFYYDSLKDRLHNMDINVEDVYPVKIFKEHSTTFLPFGLITSFFLLPSIVGEKEDIVDIEFVAKNDKFETSDLKFQNEESAKRYKSRMTGVIGDCVRLNLI